jgi:transglutaminase-like putative cysteine protease
MSPLNARSYISRSEQSADRGRRHRNAAWFLLAVSLALPVAALAADPAVSIAVPSAWVSPLPFQRLTKPDETNSGLGSRLLLRDVQINALTHETFFHQARQLLSPQGVQTGSQISIDFDAGRQALVLHWVRVLRGPNVVNELDLTRVKIIQPERDLDQYLFTGEQSALLILDDVRVGDIVEFACSIRGESAGSGAKSFGRIPAREYEPVERLATRLIWPQDRHLYLKNHGTDPKPGIIRKDAQIEYTWDFKKVPGLRREEPLPVGFDPLPWVQWSEFQKWSDVNQWAMPIFTNTRPLSPDLTRQIAQWRLLRGREDQVLAVLRFLQDEVRYQGIETGAASYTPADPSLVFARRFGDCKDKTLLFVTILRALGIEANPVLVSTELRQAIRDWQPTPTAFNHAIVQVLIDNRDYWLDATASFERGPLAARSWPNYRFGLVVRPKTTDLTPIPESPVQPRTTVLEFAMLRPVGLPTDLRVVTIAEGPDAVALRRRFATTDRTTIATDDLNAFAALYPGITAPAPLEYVDDEKANKVVVTSYYQIAKIWSPVPTGPGFVCRFYAYNIERAARKPAVSARSMPLGLTWPEHQMFHAEITLIAPVSLEAGAWPVNNPAFHFHKAVSRSPGMAVLEEEYDALAESVPVEAVPGYLLQLDAVSDLMGFALFAF